MRRKLSEYKHVGLLATLLTAQTVQPLVGTHSLAARIVSAAAILAVTWAVFLQLLMTKRERWAGAVLITPAILSEFGHYALPDSLQQTVAITSHVSIAAFLAFAVCVILIHVFQKRSLSIDDVVGAFSGYIITAIIWGNLYAMTWILVPDAFNIDSHIISQLGEWHTRRGLFAYFSFATLASIGYGDITTTAPASNTLVWMEVMFGQFYMAVVVATIVGTRMARALEPKAPDES
jgi:hypothetical protein